MTAAAFSNPAFDAIIDSNPRLAGSAGRIDSSLSPREFIISAQERGFLFSAGAQSALVAAADYLLTEWRRGHQPVLPLRRKSPFANRLIMEDFAFGCYQPTGFNFDRDAYARNLAALGYTSMECNRFSQQQPIWPFHWNYFFTNPSPAWFIETPLHNGAIPAELLAANRRELEANIAAAVKYGLEPSITSFLPRPYPESFFEVHPGWRGPAYTSDYFTVTGHPTVYSLDTDNPEVQEFYRQVYSRLLDDFPQIRHLFFWHSDLGASFWGNGEGPKKLTLLQRISGFHRMIRQEIDRRHLDIKVWLNPWMLAPEGLSALAEVLPPGVNFSVKDNPGLPAFAGSGPYEYEDATIIRGELGEIPQKIFRLAEETNREVCLGQYHDFSEDLDPIIGAPHPVMTFRKFVQLRHLQCPFSATHWGVISPDLLPLNLNQEVIREMTWGNNAETFNQLFAKIVPADFSSADQMALLKAVETYDRAFQLWPQIWGTRLQDMGMRLRWLARPFKIDGNFTEAEQSFLIEHQIYRLVYHEPYNAFMAITPEQALEYAGCYEEMTALCRKAAELLKQVNTTSQTQRQFVNSLLNPGELLRLFWTTIQNILAFYGTRDAKCIPDDDAFRRQELQRIVDDEIVNTRATIAFLQAHPGNLVIAERGEWGQCFGSNILEVFTRKLELMSASR